MRPIQKKFPPKELLDFYKHLNTLPSKEEDYPNSTFDYLKDDEKTVQVVQLSIAEEQGFICCYCMERLKTYEDSYKRKRVKIEIEHYKPKSIFDGHVNPSDKANLLCDQAEKLRADLRIDYKNLLGACGQNHHCGNAKGDWELCHIPNPAMVKAKDFIKIGYNFKGKIRSLALDEEKRENVHQELEMRLQLNHQTLKRKRQGAWNGIRNYIKAKLKIRELHQGGAREIRLAKDLIIKYSSRDKYNRLLPYCDFIVYLLRREYKGKL